MLGVAGSTMSIIRLKIVLPQRNYRLGRLEYPIGAFGGDRGRFVIECVKLHLDTEHKAQPLLGSNTKVNARTSSIGDEISILLLTSCH